jgi:hypothetical protein
MRPDNASAAPDDAFGLLVAEVLERIEREGLAALEEACRAHPAHADKLRQRVRTLRELGFVPAPEETDPARRRPNER